MTQILITGGGHGGTNMLSALVRSFGLTFDTQKSEDRDFFDKIDNLPLEYGAKLAVENRGYTEDNWHKMLKANPSLKVGFVTRHPIDHAMARMVRGQPKSKGGDNSTEVISPDCETLEIQIQTMLKVFDYYKFFKSDYLERTFFVKMEDLIVDIDGIANDFKKFMNLDSNGDYKHFLDYNTNKYHKGRYGPKVCVEELYKYKNFYKAYNGFFTDPYYDGFLDMLKRDLKEMIEEMGYEV